MPRQAIIVTRVENLQLNGTTATLKGLGVVLNQSNREKIISEFGYGVASIAHGAPNSHLDQGGQVNELFVGVGRVSSPGTFSIQIDDDVFNFDRQSFDSARSVLSFDAIVAVYNELRNRGVKTLVDGFNLLLYGE